MRNPLFAIPILIGAFTCFAVAAEDTAQPVSHYDGPIIDMHIHAFTDSNPMLGITHPPTLRGKTYTGAASAAQQRDATLAKFREHNIVKAVVTNGHLWADGKSEGILIGRANMTLEELRHLHADGSMQLIAEMSPFYAGVLADDPSQMAYLELAQELDVPVGFHIFPGGPNGGIHLMPKMLGGMRTYNAHPQQLEDALVKFPGLRLYIMHGGWPFVDELKALMYAHPNLYVEVAVVNWILPQAELEAYLKALVTAGFGDRILYGSDQMAWPDVISEGIKSINNVGFLTLEQKEDIFYDNAARFLRLSDKEIKRHKEKRIQDHTPEAGK